MKTVLIRGAGDLASGAAAQLHRRGWRVIMTELPQPLSVRCQVCFSRSVYEGRCRVEEIEARRLDSLDAWEKLPPDIIFVTTLPYRQVLAAVRPALVVDGIMAKHNLGLSMEDAPLVVALGPAFAQDATVTPLSRPSAVSIWAGPYMRALPPPIPACPG